jgi:hypothetical protein
MGPHDGLYSSCQNSPTTAADIIIGNSRSVVISPLNGITRLSRTAMPKPTITWPPTETSTYLAVIEKLLRARCWSRTVAMSSSPAPDFRRGGRHYGSSSFLRIFRFHITDDSLPTIVHMDMLDANELLSTIAQPSQYLDLSRVSPH